jgi:hypothetical protein
LAQDNINKVKEVNNQVSISSGEIHHPNYDYDDDPLQQFTYALKAPETKRQYLKD